jgi:hypothetical protein
MLRHSLLALLLTAACSKPSPQAAAPAPGSTADLEQRLVKLEKKFNRLLKFLEDNGVTLPPDPDDVFSVPIGPNDPVDGPATARVTIIEAFEFA